MSANSDDGVFDVTSSLFQDGNDNRIRRYPESDAVSANRDDGVFEGELQLSEQPVQGDWKINVDAQVRTRAVAVGPARKGKLIKMKWNDCT